MIMELGIPMAAGIIKWQYMIMESVITMAADIRPVFQMRSSVGHLDLISSHVSQ